MIALAHGDDRLCGTTEQKNAQQHTQNRHQIPPPAVWEGQVHLIAHHAMIRALAPLIAIGIVAAIGSAAIGRQAAHLGNAPGIVSAVVVAGRY